MVRQISFMQSFEPGFSKDYVAVLDGTHILRQQTESFRQELISLPGVSNVAHAETLPGRPFGQSPMKYSDLDGAPVATLARAYTGFDFIETLQIELVAGRTPDLTRAADSLSAVLTQSAALALGSEDPIGLQLERQDNGLLYTVVGVVRDFNIASLHEEISPVALFGPDPEYDNRPRQLFGVRLDATSMRAGLSRIEGAWRARFPAQPAQISLLSAEMDARYQSELRMSRLLRIFTIVSILIAGFGVFGLSAYLARFRRREIGIRKALGANVMRIVRLLAVDFLRPVAVAMILAVPIAVLFLQDWLAGFAYRITLSPLLFLGVAAVMLLIATGSVGFQTIRTALSNPVDSLREN